jgi:hypothetical protein
MARSTALLFLSASVLLGTAACAAPSDDAAEPVGEDEAEVSATKFYDCNGGERDSNLNHLEVGLASKKLSITDLSKDAMSPDVGELDADYNPSAAYAGAIRFGGWSKLLSEMPSDVGHIEVIVSKELKAKATTGKLWIRTSGSGGDSTQYYCKAKPAKLKVSTSVKSRIACELDKLICQDDNPPGETCLGDVFINQTATGASGSATLRLAYLDHFGVNIVKRNVNVGASSDLSRTTRSFKGEWGGHDLSLTYRGGITYTGKLTLPDGRSQTVKCNDLAMLDD